MTARWALYAVSLMGCCGLLWTAPGSGVPVRAQAPVAFGLAVHLPPSTDAGALEAFVAGQVARANQIFAPHAVRFSVAQRRALQGSPRMVSRSDRNALGAQALAEDINVFVVDSLMDVDEPPRIRRGVHWRSTTHAPAHYVILSRIAEPDVLAHELGHFLGNPRHSDVPGNLMSYSRNDGLPFLDAGQVRRMRRFMRKYLETGELVNRAAVLR